MRIASALPSLLLLHAASAGFLCRTLMPASSRGWMGGAAARALALLGCVHAAEEESPLPWASVCTLAADMAAPAAAPDAAPEALGVPPWAGAKYASLRQGTFRCLDGSGEVAAAAVNDDFCDCSDGSDEPGTSACDDLPGRCFYCRNKDHTPKFIYASRVDDGICDCCDGSDERDARRVTCPNTCQEVGAVAKVERGRRRQALVKGLEILKDSQAKAEAAVTEWRAEKQKLEQELPGLKKAQDAARKRKEAAQARVDEETKAAGPGDKKPQGWWQRTKQFFGNLFSSSKAAPSEELEEVELTEEPVDSKAAGEAAESAPEAAKEPPADEGEKPQTSEYAKWALDQDAKDAPAKAEADDASNGGGEAAGGEQPQTSEYAKWALDQDGKGAPAPPPQAAGEQPQSTDGDGEDDGPDDGPGDDDDASEDDDGEEDVAESREEQRQAEESPPESSGPKTDAKQELDKAREASREADKAHRAAKDKVGELDEKLGRDFGASFRYFSLNDKCVEKQLGEYNYKICFFKDAKQNHVRLGEFEGFEKSGAMKFKRGESCPGGDPRTIAVHFVCGEAEEILSVLEPSRCTYEAQVSHPVGCREQDLEGLSDSVAATRASMPHEEL